MRLLEQSRFVVVVFKDRNWAKVTGWEERFKACLAECSADSEKTGSVQKGLEPARWVASIHQD